MLRPGGWTVASPWPGAVTPLFDLLTDPGHCEPLAENEIESRMVDLMRPDDAPPRLDAVDPEDTSALRRSEAYAPTADLPTSSPAVEHHYPIIGISTGRL